MIATDCPAWCAGHLGIDDDRHESVGVAVTAETFEGTADVEVRAALWGDDGEDGPLSVPRVIFEAPFGELILTADQALALANALQSTARAITQTR